MDAEFGLNGWLLLAFGWLAAGVGVAWLFGRFSDAGKGERSNREVPSAVSLYTDPAELDRTAEPPRAAGPIAASADRPAKL